jgi:hypothetical protein
MYKTGTILLISVVALVAAGGAAGYTSGPIAITADNGATVTPVDDHSALVTLNSAGNTKISASAPVDANTISNDTTVAAGDAATVLDITVSVAPATT